MLLFLKHTVRLLCTNWFFGRYNYNCTQDYQSRKMKQLLLFITLMDIVMTTVLSQGKSLIFASLVFAKTPPLYIIYSLH